MYAHIAACLIGCAALAVRNPGAPIPVRVRLNDTLMNHKVVTDASGSIVPWPDTRDPFTTAFELAWDYWTNGSIPDDPATHLPLYYFYGSFNVNTQKGRIWPSTPGSMVNYMAQSAVTVFAYSGNLRTVTSIAAPLARFECGCVFVCAFECVLVCWFAAVL